MKSRTLTFFSNNIWKFIVISIKMIELIIYLSSNLKSIQLKLTSQKSNHFWQRKDTFLASNWNSHNLSTNSHMNVETSKISTRLFKKWKHCETISRRTQVISNQNEKINWSKQIFNFEVSNKKQNHIKRWIHQNNKIK